MFLSRSEDMEWYRLWWHRYNDRGRCPEDPSRDPVVVQLALADAYGRSVPGNGLWVLLQRALQEWVDADK